MQTGNLRYFIAVSAVLIALILIAQLFWINKLYSYEERQFTTNVVKAIRGLYEDLELDSESSIHLQQAIERPNANTFRFKIATIPEKDSLINYLVAEMQDFDVFAECRMTVYDHVKNQNSYTAYLPMTASHYPKSDDSKDETITKNYSYVSLFFPKRKEYILNELRWWILSAAFVLTLVAGFAASLFYLYRQKFLNEIQSDFIKNVTHEFQTPLTTLNLGLDMISQSYVRKSPEKLDRYTSVMKAQTRYLQHHLENLVRVIRTDSLGIKLKKESINPVTLIEQALHQLHFLAMEKNAAINFNPAETNRIITGDSSHLYLAILNIISNALKFSETPEINITTSANEKYYIISIKDNGIGIPKKHQRLIFKKFYRVPTGDVHDVKGLGLGLYFVKKIIRFHKGKIEVHSKPNEGTTFIISLPSERIDNGNQQPKNDSNDGGTAKKITHDNRENEYSPG